MNENLGAKLFEDGADDVEERHHSLSRLLA